MQGVQISNSGRQVDACAGANGGVHSVLQHPQTVALTVHSRGHEEVSYSGVTVLLLWKKLPAVWLHLTALYVPVCLFGCTFHARLSSSHSVEHAQKFKAKLESAW